MNIRKSLAVALCAASVVTLALPLTASAEVGIFFNVAPPPLRYEEVPPARQGYQWSPGYWNAHNNRHVWQAGHWERDRPGYTRSHPTWTQRERWQFEPGRWNRNDRDGDGVPNNRDRQPDNPRRN